MTEPMIETEYKLPAGNHQGPWKKEEVLEMVELAKLDRLSVKDSVIIGHMLESYYSMATKAERAIHQLTK